MSLPSKSLWRTVKEAGVGQVVVVEEVVVAAKAPVVADMAAARKALAAATAVVQPVAMAVPNPVGMAAVTQAECTRGPSMPAPRRMALE